MKSILSTVCLSTFLFATAPSAPANAAKPAATASAPKVFSTPQKEGSKASCPVTGEGFTIDKDTLHVTHKGKHVYFCCPGCQKPFDKDPDKYTK